MNNLHRWINTCLTILVLGGLLTVGIHSYKYYTINEEQAAIMSEISQIVSDEGFKSCPYKDTEGKLTIGFGHLVQAGESFDKCISTQEGILLLKEDYMIAKASVEGRYPWAEGEVKLVLTNMTYQLGPTGVSKFDKSLSYLRKEEYLEASMELLDSKWHAQTKERSMRLAVRILALEE